MSGHFGRLTYDPCFIKEDTKQSTTPGNYRLFEGQHSNNNPCHSIFGPRNNRIGNSSEVDQGASIGDRTEIETSLLNRDAPASRCMNNRSLEEKKKKITTELERNINCDNYLNDNHSRLNHPMDNFRGLTTFKHQMDFPLINPTDTVFNGHNPTTLVGQKVNSRFGTSTRLEAKDEYKNSL